MRTWLIGVCFWLAASAVDCCGQSLDLLAGDSLQLWVQANGAAVSSPKWVVSGGELHLTAGGGGDLFYRYYVGNFRLSFEWKVSPRGNSGVKYRVQQYGGSWLGCEYQIEDRGPDAPLTNQSTGALYAVYEPSSAGRPLAVGEWNQAEIVVRGNVIEHWLNGGLVVRANPGSADWMRRVASSKFAPHVGWGQNPLGRLMLQDHGNEVWYRNLRLTLLPDGDGTACPTAGAANAGNSVGTEAVHIGSAPQISDAATCPDDCDPRRRYRFSRLRRR